MENFVKVLLTLALVNYVTGSPQISLEYNPYPLPSYNPNPGQNTAHTVPPGKPWPASIEDYNTFSQTSSTRPPAPSNPTVENRFQETTTPKKETARPNLDYGKPPASLEYNPYPLPSYNPNPGENTALTIPPGKPWPANPGDYNSFSQTSSARPPTTVENRFQETTTPKKETARPTLDYGKPPASLEYNPYPLPSFKPNPGQNTAHTVPPGKPWPANPEDYNSFSQTSSARPKPMVENRFQETTTTTARPNLDYGKPPASLEYNPHPLPSYNPNPGENTALTIPPGKPWPANPPTSTTNQNLSNRIQEAYLVYPEDLWFVYLSDRFREMISNSGTKETFVLDYKPSRLNPTEMEPVENPAILGQNQNPQVIEKDEDQVQPLIVLDHKPNPPPFYRPSPTEVPSTEIHQNIENRVGPIPDQVPPLVVLDYKPNRPFYRPSPTEIQQLVPPGEPWPANPEDYATFGQSQPQNVENRFQEAPPEQMQPLIVLDYKPNRPSPTEIQQIVPPGNPVQSQQNIENRLQETTSIPAGQVQPLIVLDYKPNRPFYRPSPTEIQQIVPPGKPWPANQEDYATFSKSSSTNPTQSEQQIEQNVENRFQEPPPAPAAQVQPLTVLDYKPNRPFYRPSPTEIQQIVPPGNPWPATNPVQSQQNIENRLQETMSTSAEQVQPLIVLDYKPNRPFYRPSPTEIQQVVPPGKPWPATPTQQTIENRFEEITTPKQEGGAIDTKPQLVLDYKPSRPSFHPNPGGVIGQVVPPGKPLPATPTQQTSEEATTHKQENEPIETIPSQEKPSPPQNQGQTNRPQTVLEYYPVNAINQGSSIGQVVRPGKPWPANPEDYNSSNLRSTQNINDETRKEDAQPMKEDSPPMKEVPQPIKEVSQLTTESSQPVASTTKGLQPMAQASQPTTEDISELMLFTSKLLPTLLPMQPSSDKDKVNDT